MTSRGRVILLVEDNASDEKLALLAFRRCGFASEVVVMRDGQAALEHLLGPGTGAPLPPLPAVVLLDLKLPRIDGNEVLRRLRAAPRTRHLPIVVLTASKQDEDILRSYTLGANAYVR